MYQVRRLRVLSLNITMTVLLLLLYGIEEINAVYTESMRNKLTLEEKVKHSLCNNFDDNISFHISNVYICFCLQDWSRHGHHLLVVNFQWHNMG